MLLKVKVGVPDHHYSTHLPFKNLAGSILELDVEPSSNIEDVKKSVQEKTGIHPSQIRLIHGGKAM